MANHVYDWSFITQKWSENGQIAGCYFALVWHSLFEVNAHMYSVTSIILTPSGTSTKLPLLYRCPKFRQWTSSTLPKGGTCTK